MKILYSAGKLNGSNKRLGHFLSRIPCEYRIASYYKYNDYIPHIHWCLDTLGSKFYNKDLNFPINKIDKEKLFVLIEDIDEWKPDLIISDYEPITAYIAKLLNIRLWSCSPMHLIDGFNWNGFKNKSLFSSAKFEAFKHAERKFIYSSFGLVQNEINPGYEWVLPYDEFENDKYRNNNLLHLISKKLDEHNSLLSTGETHSISYGIRYDKPILVADSKNIECKLNGVMVENLELGFSVGEFENNPMHAKDLLEKFLNRNYGYSSFGNYKQLHEMIYEY